MSSALAIASVTAVLKDLLDNAMIDHSVSANVGGTVTVTALAPDRIETGDKESAQLNLFLYHITPNPGWRNVGQPSRNEHGERLTNPPLAIDLYYLMTAYGKQDFEAEILLGYAAQLLHETPVLTRNAIRKALSPPSPVGGILPLAAEALVASDLADQVELIKISPYQMSIEEISKLWTAFQTKYRTSVAYHVSVVLIESKYPARSPLPVLTRGQPDLATGRDEGVKSQPSLIPPYPTLQEAIPQKKQPAVRMGEILTMRGHHLDGDLVTAHFTHVRSSGTLELAVSAGATSIECHVQIPPDPAPGPVSPDSPQNPDNWQAGVYSVAAVIHRTNQPDRITNELPVVLAPRIKNITSSTTGSKVTLTVECSPKIWKTQQVTLVIGDREIAAESITQDKTDILTFISSDLPGGPQWVRLRVDGIDSILIDRNVDPPTFDSTQKVTI